MRRNNHFILLLVLLLGFSGLVMAEDAVSPDASPMKNNQEERSASVIQSFSTDGSATSDLVVIKDKTKRLVMFLMGVPLLILLLATAALGVAMGVYGKRVFVPHMVCAGLSLTLALAHAVVGIVWFYPF